MEVATTFQRELAAAGLAGLGYPEEYGGRGLPPEYEEAWREVAGEYPRMAMALAITMGMCLKSGWPCKAQSAGQGEA